MQTPEEHPMQLPQAHSSTEPDITLPYVIYFVFVFTLIRLCFPEDLIRHHFPDPSLAFITTLDPGLSHCCPINL